MFEFSYQVSPINPFWGLILAFLYFLPCGIAFLYKHKSKYGIFVLNLLLGWTFIFWVVSLAWALGKKD